MMKIFIFFFPLLIVAQYKIPPQSIDAELKKSEVLIREGKYREYMKTNMLLLNNSKKTGYSKGIASACLNLAYGYSYGWDYKKSLEYLKQAKNEEYADDFDFQVAIKKFLGFNYSNLELYHEAIVEFKEVAVLSDKITQDTSRVYMKSSAYYHIGEVYQKQNQLDSSSFYLKKGITILKSEKKLTPKLKSLLIWHSMGLVEIYITRKKNDSAAILLQSLDPDSAKLLGNHNFRLYKIKGLVSEKNKHYEEAAVYYEKAIWLAEKTGNIEQVQWLYNAASNTFKKAGNKVAAEKYFYQYAVLHDRLEDAKFYAIENVVKELVFIKEEKIKDKSKFPFFIIGGGAFGIILFITLMIKRVRRKNKILNSKEHETKSLSKKLDRAFEQVVQLAKNNDPEFLTRFQEVYPEFFPALLKIEPQLLNTELKFCALLFLNFSTKDIATYTFVQPQSVQTRKNRLRKKLNITSEEDIYSWMRNMSTNNF